jgi:hypothetical protein
MNTGTVFLFAVLVFALMVVGLFLNMREFNRLTDEPPRRKGVQFAHDSTVER